MSAPTLGLLLPAVPFAVAVIGLLLPVGRRTRRIAGVLGVSGAAAALATAVALLATLRESAQSSVDWVRFGDLTVTAGVLLDRPAALVAVAVTAVALAVQVYSIGYLHDDDRYAPYAAQVSLFTAAMLLVVVAGDLILLLVGWEVMGICSYLLIGHDRRLPEAPAAAVKAFLVTRVGDVGFLLGIAVLGIAAGSFRIADVLRADYSPVTLTVGCLLLLAGVAGKSAQFPLHTWLPDAMAGPTPISALIHAATMVAAGVYVVARLFPLFSGAPVALAVLGLMAAVTLLLGAFAATAQDDIKRVLAWSTVSQLGYMTGALAVGAPSAALFHLLTHAAFKALLFLAAGAVIHAVGTNLMSGMGGLRRPMPETFWCMGIGLGALAGLPPLAGFWSKETVLVAAANARDGHGPGPAWVALLVWLAALIGVAVTAWYATRLLLRTFFGPAGRWATQPPVAASSGTAAPGTAAPGTAAAGAEPAIPGPVVGTAAPVLAPHDPPGLMHWPIAVLALPATVLGLFALAPDFRTDLGLVEPHLDAALALPLLLSAAGALAAWWTWRRAPAQDPTPTVRTRPVELAEPADFPRSPEPVAPARPPRRLIPARPGRLAAGLQAAFGQAFWLDAVQHHLVVRPVRALARAARGVDERVVDGAVEGTGHGTVRLGGWLALAHRAGLPRAAVAVLAGALLLGLAAVLLTGGTQ